MHVTNLKLSARHLETRTSKLTYSFRDTSTMRTGSRKSKRHYKVRARRRLSTCDFPSLQALFCYPIAALSKIYLLQGARHTHTIRYEIRLDYVIDLGQDGRDRGSCKIVHLFYQVFLISTADLYGTVTSRLLNVLGATTHLQ